jgi:hypothetical protein
MQLIVLLLNATVLESHATGMKVDGGETCKGKKRRVLVNEGVAATAEEISNAKITNRVTRATPFTRSTKTKFDRVCRKLPDLPYLGNHITGPALIAHRSDQEGAMETVVVLLIVLFGLLPFTSTT